MFHSLSSPPPPRTSLNVDCAAVIFQYLPLQTAILTSRTSRFWYDISRRRGSYQRMKLPNFGREFDLLEYDLWKKSRQPLIVTLNQLVRLSTSRVIQYQEDLELQLECDSCLEKPENCSLGSLTMVDLQTAVARYHGIRALRLASCPCTSPSTGAKLDPPSFIREKVLIILQGLASQLISFQIVRSRPISPTIGDFISLNLPKIRMPQLQHVSGGLRSKEFFAFLTHGFPSPLGSVYEVTRLHSDGYDDPITYLHLPHYREYLTKPQAALPQHLLFYHDYDCVFARDFVPQLIRCVRIGLITREMGNANPYGVQNYFDSLLPPTAESTLQEVLFSGFAYGLKPLIERDPHNPVQEEERGEIAFADPMVNLQAFDAGQHMLLDFSPLLRAAHSLQRIQYDCNYRHIYENDYRHLHDDDPQMFLNALYDLIQQPSSSATDDPSTTTTTTTATTTSSSPFLAMKSLELSTHSVLSLRVDLGRLPQLFPNLTTLRLSCIFPSVGSFSVLSQLRQLTLPLLDFTRPLSQADQYPFGLTPSQFLEQNGLVMRHLNQLEILTLELTWSFLPWLIESPASLSFLLLAPSSLCEIHIHSAPHWDRMGPFCCYPGEPEQFTQMAILLVRLHLIWKQLTPSHVIPILNSLDCSFRGRSDISNLLPLLTPFWFEHESFASPPLPYFLRPPPSDLYLKSGFNAQLTRFVDRTKSVVGHLWSKIRQSTSKSTSHATIQESSASTSSSSSSPGRALIASETRKMNQWLTHMTHGTMPPTTSSASSSPSATATAFTPHPRQSYFRFVLPILLHVHDHCPFFMIAQNNWKFRS